MTKSNPMALKRTLNCLTDANQIRHKPLHVCLGKMGATPPRKHVGGNLVSTCQANGKIGSGFFYLDQWELHDLYIECHKIWVEGCKIIQTHLIENHEAAAKWNALWERTEELLKRKGAMA